MKRLNLLLILAFFSTTGLSATLLTTSGDPALSGATLVDFNSEAQGSFTSRTFNDFVTFSGNNPLYIESTYGGLYGSTGNYLANRSSDSPFTISFSNPVSAFGFSWGAADQPWTMKLFDINNALLDTLSISAQTNPYIGFIGASNNPSISKAVLTDQSSYGYDYFLLDNFKYVQASNGSTVPEPATFALLGLGAFGFYFSHRRKRIAA